MEQELSALNAENHSLTVDEKLDKIMETVVFQTKLLVSALVAFDKKMQEGQAPSSKIIKPVL